MSVHRGFTLVELLVVISIIAILAVIGITVFSGVQKNARDSRRKGDLDAIAKALEIKKSTTGNTYYTPLAAADFAGGAVPDDPTPTTQRYCFFGTSIASGQNPASIVVDNTFKQNLAANSPPSGYSMVTCDGGIAYHDIVQSGIPLNDATHQIDSWAICAKMESTSQVVCNYNQL